MLFVSYGSSQFLPFVLCSLVCTLISSETLLVLLPHPHSSTLTYLHFLASWLEPWCKLCVSKKHEVPSSLLNDSLFPYGQSSFIPYSWVWGAFLRCGLNRTTWQVWETSIRFHIIYRQTNFDFCFEYRSWYSLFFI